MPVARPESSDTRIIAHIDMDCFYVQDEVIHIRKYLPSELAEELMPMFTSLHLIPSLTLLTRSIFFVVEQRRQPHLRGFPTAVVQYNSWKGGGLIAVSYEARKFGVKRSMRGDEAKKVCPQIQLVQVPVARGKADLNNYRNAGSEVVSILARKGRCERASIDEVYLDLTDAAETMLVETPPERLDVIDEEALKSHVLGLDEDGGDIKETVRNWLCRSDADHRDKLLACGALIVAELRIQVLKETEFTCSAGIAHNKMLAKLASAMNKPAQQTVVPFSSVKGLLDPLPIKKMKQLGGKLGSSLQSDLGVNTVGDLLQFSEEKLQERYGINTGTWLWNIARGISGDEVEGRLLPKSHGSGKTFPGPQALKTIASVKHWLNELCEELSERLLSDLDQHKRIAHTLTLHARAYKHSSDSESHRKFPSKSCPLRYGTAKIQEDAINLFQAGLREYLRLYGVKTLESQSSGWGITGLSISASKIVAIPSGTCSITKFFQTQEQSCFSSKQSCSMLIQEAGPLSCSGTEGCSGLTLTEPEAQFLNEEIGIKHSKAHDESCSSSKQSHSMLIQEAGPLSPSGTEVFSGLKLTEPQAEFPNAESRTWHSKTNLCHQEEISKTSKEQGTSSVTRFFHDLYPSSSSSKLQTDQVEYGTSPLPSTSNLDRIPDSGVEGFPSIDHMEIQKSFTAEDVRIKSSAVPSLEKRQQRQKISKDKGTSSILRFFQSCSSSSLVTEEKSGSTKNTEASPFLAPEILRLRAGFQTMQDGIHMLAPVEEATINSHEQSSGQIEQRETWNYRIDEIDPSVMEELPPEIQQEVWAWVRPHKRAHTAKQGSSIAHYFLPAKGS
ncbi:DNA polymerase, Y-family, little finger domain [Dillenia turbinata]|uniref:DNA polymerase eta n=1 Tax=Dillenia turbinata TaxID=194707 RepID=A0AAN8VCS5_9MAGN